MKYLMLPVHLLEFWYPEGLSFFIRTWKNLMLFLEEDLAVGLMWKLLFTPLFHDATIVGRILSFLFRVGRILIGLFAYALATLLVFALSIYWLLLPIFAILDTPRVLSQLLLFSGLGLFLIHKFTHPHKKVWQVAKDELFEASNINKDKLKFGKLLTSAEVIRLLSNLELQITHFPNWEIKDVEQVAITAFELAKRSGSSYIGPAHFFVAALKEIPNLDKFLITIELKDEDFENSLFYQEKKKIMWRKVWIWDDDFTIHHLRGVNRGWLGAPTPTLDSVSDDLTRKAAKEGFPPFIRESGVVEEVVNILSQKTGRNVIVVGPPGSGKSSLIRNLARQILIGDAPEALATKRLVLLDLAKLLSGVKTQGELANRVKEIFEELGFVQNIILVIEEIHELGVGEVGGSLNLYSLMQPYLESDTFQFIGTTEAGNYSNILEKNGAFARIFRKVELQPASPKDTLNVLQDRAIRGEREMKVNVTYVALKKTVDLAQKFIHDRVLPDSAISVLKDAQVQNVNGWVTKEVIRRVVSLRVKVPIMEVDNVDKTRLLKLESEIHNRMIDQEQAVKAVADALRRSATGLREEKRPIGSFLFVGPTGVGKTELARTLALVYFKTAGAFIQLDMSEYQTVEAKDQLTEAVRQRPYALLLLDEFEKASSKILTLFLQVLEEGRLTDGAGRPVDFTNTIIIATSNAASLTIAQGLGEGKSMDQIDKQVNDEILKIFKPELINRFDDVVIFKPLTEADLEKIVVLKLKALQEELKGKGYLVEFDPSLVSELAKRGFDPVLGARPLRRLIQDTLEAKLSRLILENKLTKGQSLKVGVELLAA